MTLSRQELLKHVGDMQQLAGIELLEALDGPERGVRKALVRGGSGLEFTVHLDRGFDLGEARLSGQNLTWRSPVGAVHPHAHQEPTGWLRRFPGGLLTTCGLDNVGPAEAAGPFHGRYSNTPATPLSKRAYWDGERYLSELEGEVRDYALFGPNMKLTRRIRTAHDRASIHLQDVVINEGFTRQPLMLLYHCNFGYPLLAEGGRVHVKSTIVPYDEASERGLASALELHAPQRNYEQQVFIHEAEMDAGGEVTVALVNAQRSLAAYLRYPKQCLPHLTQWKQLGEGAYVLGLEPGTCTVYGFTEEQKQGRVRWLEPGERYETTLELCFLASEAEVEGFMTAQGMPHEP